MTPPTLEDWRATLRREFQADEGSFLAIAQDERRWDKAVFRELIEAMRDCCVRCADDEQLDRWMAHGFFMSPHLCEHGLSKRDSIVPMTSTGIAPSTSWKSSATGSFGANLRRKKERLMS